MERQDETELLSAIEASLDAESCVICGNITGDCIEVCYSCMNLMGSEDVTEDVINISQWD